MQVFVSMQVFWVGHGDNSSFLDHPGSPWCQFITARDFAQGVRTSHAHSPSSSRSWYWPQLYILLRLVSAFRVLELLKRRRLRAAGQSPTVDVQSKPDKPEDDEDAQDTAQYDTQ